MRKLSLLLALIVLLSQQLLSSSLTLAEEVVTPSTSQSSQPENGKVKSTAAPTIKVNSLKIYVGQTFTATEMVDSAVDGDGLPIDFSKLTITGAAKVDTSKYGTYKIGFSYEGSDPVYGNLIVSEASQVVPISSPKNWGVGVKLDAKQLVSLTSDYGMPDYNQVTFSGQTESGIALNPDSPAIGTYNVTAAYQDTSTSFELVVKTDESELSLSQTEMTVDLSDTRQFVNIYKNPYTMVSSYKDVDGNNETPSNDNITVTKPDSDAYSRPTKVGDYVFSYEGLNGKFTTLTIHVTGDKIKLVPQDVELTVGETFNKASGLKSATDINGNVLEPSESVSNLTIAESDNVDTSKAGSYTVTYSYRGVTTTANVTIKSNSNDGIYVDNSKLTRYQNDDFNATDLLSQVLYNGESVNKSQITAAYDTSKINTVGTFDVTYTYKELKKTITVTVIEDKSSLLFSDGSNTSELSVYSEEYSEPLSSGSILIKDVGGVSRSMYDILYGAGLAGFKVTAKCTDGNITPSTSYVNYFKGQTGTVVYTLTYRGRTITRIVHVVANQTAIDTKDTTLALGSDTWKVDDNFVSATTYDGKNAKYDRVSGKVPTDASGVVNKIGVYQVKYTKKGQGSVYSVSKNATIRVVDDESQINLRAMTIYSGDSWKASDQFVSGLTKIGKPLTKDDVATDVSNTSGKLISYTITGSDGKQVDTIENAKSGKYTITYQYGSVTKSTTLTVVAYTPTINVHDSSVFVSGDWTAANNFDMAYTAAGKRLTISDLTVDDSAVDLNTPGVYQVKYTYGVTTATAEITVKERRLGINVHDSKVVIGSSWNASDNFDSASDSDGNEVTFDKLTISITDEAGKTVNTIDTSKAGTYTVTYDYTDSTNTPTQSTAKVTIYSAADLQVTNVRIPINTEWDPSLPFIAATSPSGDSQTWDQIKDGVTITGTVDPSVAKSYSLTYTYEGITKDVKVTVVGERTLTVPKSTDFGSVTLGPTSSALNLTYPGGDIKVEDSVENSKGWSLTAKVSDSTSDFNQYLMNGDTTLSQNSELGIETSGGTTTVSDGWQGTKKGLWIDYSGAQKVRTDDVTIEYTLTPSDSEVGE
ncbi:MAG: bacterial Ig-like domain-containing protein [Lactococcus lactis]